MRPRAAAAAWDGPTHAARRSAPAPIVVDALFGTGASRPLDGGRRQAVARLFAEARLRIAVDLPSGLDADARRAPEHVAAVDLTLALGALKPAHLLQPGARSAERSGASRSASTSRRNVRVLSRPALPVPGSDAHKYSRGLVAVVGGAMPGAAELAATAALRAGAGYAMHPDR